MTGMIWSFVLAGVGILGIIIAGRKSHWGWLIGAGAQVLWLIYAIVTVQYGFILSALAYGAVYLWNWWKWRQDAKPDTAAAWLETRAHRKAQGRD